MGLYSIQAYLNSYVKKGTVERHDRHGPGPHRQLVSRSAPARPIGWAWWAACRPTSSTPGDVYVSSRYYGYYYSADDLGHPPGQRRRARSCR